MTVHVFPGAGYDSNIFLVTGDEPILIDAGSGMWSNKIIGGIKERTDALSKIILTHRHFDHTGGAAKLVEQFNVPVFIHEFDAFPVKNGSSKETEAEIFGCNMLPVSVSELHGGEIIDTGEYQFQVIHTPGHTPGGISLYDADHKILFSGDTVFAEGVGRWDFTDGDLSALKRSVRKLSELDTECLYPGHGPCININAKSNIINALMYVEGF